jgi:F0F1-type ATP synthase delta subunit
MKTPRNQIVPVLAELSLQPGVDAKHLGREIAAYLLEENRTGELDSLMRDIIAYRASKGLVEVTAVSAHELSVAIRAEIGQQVRTGYKDAKKIITNERIDASMLGGVRLELVGRQLDLSVRNKLNRLKELTTAERTA